VKPSRRDDVLTYAGLLAVLVFFGAPLVWILSLRTQKDVLSPGLNPVPGDPTLENYAEVLRSAQFPQFLLIVGVFVSGALTG
jgi:multiple sugar transport system permease protein